MLCYFSPFHVPVPSTSMVPRTTPSSFASSPGTIRQTRRTERPNRRTGQRYSIRKSVCKLHCHTCSWNYCSCNWNWDPLCEKSPEFHLPVSPGQGLQDVNAAAHDNNNSNNTPKTASSPCHRYQNYTTITTHIAASKYEPPIVTFFTIHSCFEPPGRRPLF